MEARRRENPGDSIKDHIVRRFYNQRCDLVTRLRFEPVNLERGFLLFEWFVSKGGGGEVGGEKKKNWRIGPIKSRGGGGSELELVGKSELDVGHRSIFALKILYDRGKKGFEMVEYFSNRIIEINPRNELIILVTIFTRHSRLRTEIYSVRRRDIY